MELIFSHQLDFTEAIDFVNFKISYNQEIEEQLMPIYKRHRKVHDEQHRIMDKVIHTFMDFNYGSKLFLNHKCLKLKRQKRSNQKIIHAALSEIQTFEAKYKRTVNKAVKASDHGLKTLCMVAAKYRSFEPNFLTVIKLIRPEQKVTAHLLCTLHKNIISIRKMIAKLSKEINQVV